jgi:hypothetical protein
VEELLDGEAEALTNKAIELAKEGNLIALRICLDRIAPPRKDRHIEFALPKMEKASDAAAAGAAIVEAAGNGELTPSEAGDLIRMVESYARTLQVCDFEARLERLEKRKRHWQMTAYLKSRLARLEAVHGVDDSPLIFFLDQWAEGCPRAFQSSEADELIPHFEAIGLDNLMTTGKIRECDRDRVQFMVRVLA